MSQILRDEAIASGYAARVIRHRLVDRLYHWTMAIVVFVLMGSAFLPILGWKFQWLEVHWISGVLLAVLIVAHIVRSIAWQDWRSMMIYGADLRDIWRGAYSTLTPSASTPDHPGKYNALQKFYHVAVAVLILATIATGFLMLLKIDTPLWRRNPYWFSNESWGIIYAIHGLAAMAMIAMVMIHIYFALRPDEWHLTRSMIRGWITGKEHIEHHDPKRWTGS